MTQLRQMMLEELQRRNYSHRTAKTYVRIVREFAMYFHQSPDKLGPEQIRQYLYAILSRAVEASDPPEHAKLNAVITPENKRILAKLTALFSVDAFGGGFLTDALVAYWFFRRFGVAEPGLGFVFFGVVIRHNSMRSHCTR